MTVSNIEAARARAALPSNCSSCGSLAVFVIESRNTANARRRRKRCDRCGHRETTYEISQEEYKALTKGKTTPEAKPSLSCDTCIHWETTSCGMGFPEAGGRFAAECSCYSASE
jgi:hypothetical protein